MSFAGAGSCASSSVTSVRGHFTKGSEGDFIRGAIHILQVALGIQIIYRDARARHDVMEVIEKQVLPGLLHFILRIRAAEQGSDRGELFRVENDFFGAAN